MDKQSVIAHLRAWIDGVDPATGAVLPHDHPGQRTDTLRVLFAALALLESAPPQGSADERRMRGTAGAGAAKAGQRWSDAEDDALAQGFDAGTSIPALAVQLGRTRGAITLRLVKLGKIEAPPGLRMREGIAIGAAPA